MADVAQVIDFQQARSRRLARASEPWIGKAEVAAHLGVSPRTVNRYMRAGMPYRRRFEHSFPRFQISAVEDWMEGRGA